MSYLRIIIPIFILAFLSNGALAEANETKCQPDSGALDVPEPSVTSKKLTVESFEVQKKYINECKGVLMLADAHNQKFKRSQIESILKTLKGKLQKYQDLTLLVNQLDDNQFFKSAYTAKSASQPLIDEIDLILKTQHPDYLIPSWREVAFSYQFYTGVEYNKVGDLFDDSNLRLGFQGYLRLGRAIERLRHDEDGKCDPYESCGRWLKNLPHLIGNVVLTGAAESLEQDNTSESEEESGQNFESIEYELATFWPIYVGNRGDILKQTYQEFAVGLIASAGGRKVDGTDNFQDRLYGGVRFANNEETYLDVLYGKSEPLIGRRMEIRGQLPVSNLGGGKLFLGGSANFEVERKKRDIEGNLVNEEDSFKIYVIWQTTFDSLWKGLSNDS